MAAKHSLYTGTGVNLIVPITSDNEIDFKALKLLVERVKKQGADFLVILDNACDSKNLTDMEKLRIIEAVSDYNNNELPLLIAIEGSHYNISPFIDLLSYNENSEIAKLCLLPATMTEENEILDYYSFIARNSNCNIIVDQHSDAIPLDISVLKKLTEQFSNIVGIVVRDRSIDRIIDLRNSMPANFAIFGDYERLALPGIAVGMSGIISIVANVFTSEISNFFNLAMVGKQERSRKVFYDMLPIIDKMYTEGAVRATKATLALEGIGRNFQRLNLVEQSKEAPAQYSKKWPEEFMSNLSQHSSAMSA